MKKLDFQYFFYAFLVGFFIITKVFYTQSSYQDLMFLLLPTNFFYRIINEL